MAFVTAVATSSRSRRRWRRGAGGGWIHASRHRVLIRPQPRHFIRQFLVLIRQIHQHALDGVQLIQALQHFAAAIRQPGRAGAGCIARIASPAPPAPTVRPWSSSTVSATRRFIQRASSVRT